MIALRKLPHWLAPVDGVMRRTLTVLVLAASVFAALLATTHVHGGRTVHQHQSHAWA
jgi:hypothetical protein